MESVLRTTRSSGQADHTDSVGKFIPTGVNCIGKDARRFACLIMNVPMSFRVKHEFI
jgi:hypothetical protein